MDGILQVPHLSLVDSLLLTNIFSIFRIKLDRMSGLGILSTYAAVSGEAFSFLDDEHADSDVAVLIREATFNWQTETFSKC